MFFNQEKLKHIIQTAHKAGDAILKKYGENTSFEFKEDDTPLTEIDLLSHTILIKNLRHITPNIPILSEESEYIDFKQRKQWNEYWLIDPLDGTRGFIDKTDDFCICISYIKHNTPVFGLIYAPILQTFYLANSLDVAYKITDNRWQKISASPSQKPLRVIVGKYSTHKKHLKQHLNTIYKNDNYTITGMGSALKFCFIAEGKYDYYPALGMCSEWDTAAGSFILKAAGGYVLDFSYNSLKYNTKNNLISPLFFASGDFKFSGNK